MVNYSFIVKVMSHGTPLGERTVRLSFQDDSIDLKNLQQAAREAEKRYINPNLYNALARSRSNMCEFDFINDICHRIKENVCKQYPSAETIAQEEIQTIKDADLSFEIEFPPELLYPHIWRQDGCLTMENCLSLDKLEEGEEAVNLNALNAYYLRVWLNYGPYTMQYGTPDSGALNAVFNDRDAPLLYYAVTYPNKSFTTITVFSEGEISKYYSRHKKAHSHFGVSFSEKGKFLEITFPDFCHNARLALFRRFIVKREGVTALNSLAFQLNQLNTDDLDRKDEKIIPERIMDSFTQDDSWYYEMCTGLSLSLAVSAQLFDDSKCNSPWKEYRKTVFLKLLRTYYPVIVACPAVYWRISLMKKIIRAIDDQMEKYQNSPSSPHILPECELEWQMRADRIFGDVFTYEFTSRLMPRDFQYALNRFPKLLVRQALTVYCNSHIKTHFGSSSAIQYKPFIYCQSNDTYISDMRSDAQGIMRKGKRARSGGGNEKERIFEEVRNALYPDGFIDFQA